MADGKSFYFVKAQYGRKEDGMAGEIEAARQKEERKQRKKELEKLYSKALQEPDYERAEKILKEMKSL
ncbi:MAG: hypothetical protein Q8R12_00905 [bacterium]|nr:hypothetical protein [bacterium]